MHLDAISAKIYRLFEVSNVGVGSNPLAAKMNETSHCFKRFYWFLEAVCIQ